MRKTFAILIAVLVLLASLPLLASAVNVSNESDLKNTIENAAAATTVDVTLFADFTVNDKISIAKGQTVNLDLNGHTISFTTATTANHFVVSHGTLNVSGTGTIKELTDTVAPISITGSTDSTAKNYSVVTVGENVTLRGNFGVAIREREKEGIDKDTHSAYGVSLNIQGTLIGGLNGGGIFVNGNLNKIDGNVPEITIVSPAFLSSGSDGIYAAGYAKWYIEGGTITGPDAGVAMKAGTLNVTGGTITATGPANNAPAGSVTGVNASGAAIQIESNAGYAGNINVSISGNPTITSQNGTAILEYNAVAAAPTKVQSLSITGGTIQSLAGQTPIVLSTQLVAAATTTPVAGATPPTLSFTGGTVYPAQASIPGFASIPQVVVETVPAPATTANPYAYYTPSENAPKMGESAAPTTAAEDTNGDSNPNTGVMTLSALPFLGLLLAGAVLTRKHR